MPVAQTRVQLSAYFGQHQRLGVLLGLSGMLCKLQKAPGAEYSCK